MTAKGRPQNAADPRPESEEPTLSLFDDLGICAHGVSVGARCRHCPAGRATDSAPSVPERPQRRQVGLLPETSLEAGREAREGETATAAALLAILATAGALTDDELFTEYDRREFPPRSPQRLRTVRAGLVKAGRVRAAGRGLTDAGNPCTTWAVSNA